MSQALYVLFTMDVEPTAAALGHSGPADDQLGMQSIRDFQTVLGARGFKATYFVHPELVERYPDFYRTLHADGNDVGLHVHTTKLVIAPQPGELGSLTADEQRRLLTLAMEQFQRGMGKLPNIFRPGCFSANDATYSVLVDLGFIGGGVSIPGRIWPDRFCVWSGAQPYTHFAHKAFRQAPGNLPFVNIPLSVDLTTPLRYNPVGFYHYPDLRPGGVYSPQDEVPLDRPSMLRNILHQMNKDNPPLKTLVVDVHNDRDFVSPTSPATGHLQAVLDGLVPTCDQLGWQIVPSTYQQVIEQFNRLHRP